MLLLISNQICLNYIIQIIIKRYKNNYSILIYLIKNKIDF